MAEEEVLDQWIELGGQFGSRISGSKRLHAAARWTPLDPRQLEPRARLIAEAAVRKLLEKGVIGGDRVLAARMTPGASRAPEKASREHHHGGGDSTVHSTVSSPFLHRKEGLDP